MATGLERDQFAYANESSQCKWGGAGVGETPRSAAAVFIGRSAGGPRHGADSKRNQKGIVDRKLGKKNKQTKTNWINSVPTATEEALATSRCILDNHILKKQNETKKKRKNKAENGIPFLWICLIVFRLIRFVSKIGFRRLPCHEATDQTNAYRVDESPKPATGEREPLTGLFLSSFLDRVSLFWFCFVCVCVCAPAFHFGWEGVSELKLDDGQGNVMAAQWVGPQFPTFSFLFIVFFSFQFTLPFFSAPVCMSGFFFS